MIGIFRIHCMILQTAWSMKRGPFRTSNTWKSGTRICGILEDRYGRASKMPEIPYRKVKAPLLRDPRAEPDQWIILQWKGDQIVAKLEKQSGNLSAEPKPREGMQEEPTLRM